MVGDAETESNKSYRERNRAPANRKGAEIMNNELSGTCRKASITRQSRTDGIMSRGKK